MFKGIRPFGLRRAAIATASMITLGVGAAVWGTPAASAAPAATPTCTAADLAVWVNASEPNGAAGTIYYPLEFTNISNKACFVEGYPGVSALGARGQQLGNAADRNPAFKPARVTIPAGGTAHADLGWTDVTNFPASNCKPTAASLIKVYPPNQKDSDLGFVSLEACGAKGDAYLHISVIRPGPNGD
jgi:hypothetical protein